MSLAGKVIVITGTIDSLVEKIIEKIPIETTHTYVFAPTKKQANYIASKYGVYSTAINPTARIRLINHASHIIEQYPIDYWLNFTEQEPPNQPFSQQNLEQIFNHYCFPLIIAIETAGQVMLPQRHGTIINIIPATHHNPIYKAATTAVRTYTNAIKKQLEPHGIHVHAITPKQYPTPYTKNQHLTNEEKTTEEIIRIMNKT